jgi:predicted nucleic acid-binding protein
MQAASHLVLDTSVALGAVFADEQDAYSVAVLQALADMNAVVPVLWHLEMANILSRALRSERITADEIKQCWQHLAVLDLQTMPLEPDPRYWTERAHDWDLTSYDACYLDLARQQRLPLATRDKKLVVAARRVGVDIFQPA